VKVVIEPGQMKTLLANVRRYQGSDLQKEMRERSIEDRATSNTDLVRIGLMAAQALGAPADAMIVFVARGNRVSVPIPKSEEEAAVDTRPIEEGSPPDFAETRLHFEWIEMKICMVLNMRFAAGYSRAANTLAINLHPHGRAEIVG
jgi:hypothetical protein